jgi:hypothetical protein
LVLLVITRELGRRNRGEFDVGQPRLAVGSRNEQPSWLLYEKPPAHLKGLVEEWLRFAAHRGGAEEELPQTNDAPNRPNRLQVKGFSRGKNDFGRSTDHRSVALPNIICRKKLIEWRAQRELECNELGPFNASRSCGGAL